MASTVEKIKELETRWAGNVDFEVVKILIIRYLRGPIIFGLFNRIAGDVYEITDSFGDMENMTSRDRDKFYRKFILSKEDEVNYNWEKIEIPYQNAVVLIGEDFSASSGLTGKLLNTSANVYVSGEIEARKENLKNGKKRFNYRHVNTKWIWFDDVDANSFPGIATLKGESKNVYQNVHPDFWGILVATIEGYADYLELFTKTDFKIKINWEDKREAISDPFGE